MERDGDLWRTVGDLLEETAGTLTTLRERLRQVGQEREPAAPEPPPGAKSRTASTIAAAAADLAAAALDVDLEHAIEKNEDAWIALVTAVRASRSPVDVNAQNEDAMDLYMKLVAALPADLRRDFRRFAETHAFANLVERNAAFELGRHVERQLAALRSGGRNGR